MTLWLPLDTDIRDDPKVDALCAEFGPLGISLPVALLTQAKKQRDGGRFRIGWGPLTWLAVTDRETVTKAIERAQEYGLVADLQVAALDVAGHLPGWRRWNGKGAAALRKDRQRDPDMGDEPPPTGGVTGRDKSVTKRDKAFQKRDLQVQVQEQIHTSTPTDVVVAPDRGKQVGEVLRILKGGSFDPPQPGDDLKILAAIEARPELDPLGAARVAADWSHGVGWRTRSGTQSFRAAMRAGEKDRERGKDAPKAAGVYGQRANCRRCNVVLSGEERLYAGGWCEPCFRARERELTGEAA